MHHLFEVIELVTLLNKQCLEVCPCSQLHYVQVSNDRYLNVVRYMVKWCFPTAR